MGTVLRQVGVALLSTNVYNLTPLFSLLGRVVGGSDHTPILMLTDLVNGTYNFSLTVTNSNGKSNTDYTILRVLRGECHAHFIAPPIN